MSTMAQAQSNWEADKMLDVYIHDYFVKKKLHTSAKAFMTEGKVPPGPVAIDAPGGFLYEWWSVFWDIFISRTHDKHSESASAYIETQQTKAREQQLQMQQLQLMQQHSAQLQQRRDPNHPVVSGSLNAMNPEGMLGQQMKHPNSMDSEASPTLIDPNRMALLKSATSHQGQLVHGNSVNMSTALRQIQARSSLTTDIKGEVNLGATPKSLPMDASVYQQAILQSNSGLGGAGLNKGITSLPLKGWPLTGIDQLRPSLGVQIQNPNLTTQNQLLLASQQQQVLAQAQAQNNLGNSTNYGNMDPRRLSGLGRGSLSAKDGQSTRNDGSICTQAQSGSPKMKMAQAQHSFSQQQEQLQQNNRKRKQHSSSGAANSSGTGNTVGPSPNSPPSTHTPGDGINTASTLQHVNNAQKSMVMYGTEGTGGLASSSNLLHEDMEQFGDIGALDDNVESFLANDGGDDGNLYGTIKQGPAEQQKESSKGFTFAELSCIRTRNSKVTRCHFSSDGKLLASAGDDKKVVLWNMDTLQTESTPEEHKSVITDVRFRPNSSQLATASYDKSVRLWDAANPSYCVQEYSGHSSAVMSLDFHPKKTDLFCFCDSENEIRYWNITSSSCTRVSKGGNAQVRFQPRMGHVLAAVYDKVVSIFDVESDKQIYSLKGHPEPVKYICWDANGDVLASVSPNLVKIWTLASGECIQELSSNVDGFYSCVFHPSYSNLLVIGGFSSLEVWDMAEKKSMTIPAHKNIISALAQSPVTRMVASASYDCSVKLWK